jgi:hypothetical protein
LFKQSLRCQPRFASSAVITYNQGDQIGQIVAHTAVLLSGQLFENDKSKPTFIWMKWMDQF